MSKPNNFRDPRVWLPERKTVMMLIVSDGAIVVTSSCSVLLPAVLAFFSLLTVKNRLCLPFDARCAWVTEPAPPIQLNKAYFVF